MKGIKTTTSGHHKMMNGQLGTVIFHKGETFLLGHDNGIKSCGKTRADKVKMPVIDGKPMECTFIDPEEDQVIEGRFFGWQDHAKYWLWICPLDNMGESLTKLPVLVRFQKLR